MFDEQQDTSADDVPAGAVSAEDLKEIPDAPERDGDNLAGPRAAAEENAKHAAESAAARAAEDAKLRQ
jgi:hypothetical protein